MTLSLSNLNPSLSNTFLGIKWRDFFSRVRNQFYSNIPGGESTDPFFSSVHSVLTVC